MALQKTNVTVEEFERFVDLPENADKLFEYVAGEIVEVPSNPFASYVSGRIFRRVANHVEDNDLGFTTGEAGGYMVSGERYAPDVAFISKYRQPQLAMSGYNPNPPDLAVEVDFPTSYASQEILRVKAVNYVLAGTLLWIVRPSTKTVEVYSPDKPVRILGIDDTLDGEDVLPGFTLPVREIFPD
jgi:Uma2 family endonuclease